MAVIELVVGLVAGHAQLFDVGHDDEIAGVHVRRVDRLVLAAQTQRDLAREAAQHLVGRVDDVPIPRDVGGLGGEGLHVADLGCSSSCSKVDHFTISPAKGQQRGRFMLFRPGPSFRHSPPCKGSLRSVAGDRTRRARRLAAKKGAVFWRPRLEDSTIGGEWRNAPAVPKEEYGEAADEL